MMIEGKGRVIVNPVGTSEIAIMVDSSGRAVAILNRKQAMQLRRALFEALYPEFSKRLAKRDADRSTNAGETVEG